MLGDLFLDLLGQFGIVLKYLLHRIATLGQFCFSV